MGRAAAGAEDGAGAGAETGSVVVAPGDVRGTVLVPERGSGSCCGLDGSDGPDMNCAACGLPVARRIDDCSLWQAVRFEPGAVRRRQVADVVLLPWATLVREGAATPPLHRLATWGGGARRPSGGPGRRSGTQPVPRPSPTCWRLRKGAR
ncbi:hypothetical protein ACF1CG_22960 [Streptomyces sp. NPDC014773]|uniref:hypothetical protein n=1 Tax=Streptomyces sp. NPDC014773 TaxID=3364908 RepID=UPI0036FE24C3